MDLRAHEKLTERERERERNGRKETVLHRSKISTTISSADSETLTKRKRVSLISRLSSGNAWCWFISAEVKKKSKYNRIIYILF